MFTKLFLSKRVDFLAMKCKINSLFQYPAMSIKTPVRRKHRDPLRDIYQKISYPGDTFKKVKSKFWVSRIYMNVLFIVKSIPLRKTGTIRVPAFRHDFMNFKVMSGNEILLNLENSEYLRNGELINALLELSKRKGQEQHDWEVHPYTEIALEQVKKRIAQFTPQHLSQVSYALDRLNVNNIEIWSRITRKVDEMAHIFDTNWLANFFDVLVPVSSEDGEEDVVYLDKEIEKDQKLKRWNDIVMQQLVNVLPLKVKELNKEQLVRVIETWVSRNLGDKVLYKEYLFFYVEKKANDFTLSQYVRLLRVLGDKQYTEDPIFWNDFIFPRVYKEAMTKEEANMVKDALIALKVKCPELECEIPIEYWDSVLDNFEEIAEYDDLEEEIKQDLKYMGELPEGVTTKVRVDDFIKASKSMLEKAQQQIEAEEKERLKQEKENDPEYIRKKELREQRKLRREQRRQSSEEILYDSD